MRRRDPQYELVLCTVEADEVKHEIVIKDPNQGVVLRVRSVDAEEFVAAVMIAAVLAAPAS